MHLLSVVVEQPRLLAWHGLTLDADRLTVSARGSVLLASPAEFGLLHLLVSRRNVPLDKDFIMTSLFGSDHHRDPCQADILVARLRRLLAPLGLGEAISTVPGRGYALLDHHRTSALPTDLLSLVAA